MTMCYSILKYRFFPGSRSRFYKNEIISLILAGVWESIRSPVTKELLFQVAENERFKAPPKPQQRDDLMPPPAKIPKR